METSIRGLTIALAVLGCGPKTPPRPSTAPPELSCPDGTREVLEGVSVQYCARPDGTKHGPWLEWHSGIGRKAEEGAYADGKRTGTWTRWNDAGVVLARGDYLAGQKTGPWAFAYDDGQLQLIGSFVAGEEDGPWTAYWPDGRLFWEGAYEGGERVGTWTYTHANGFLAARGPYVHDEDGPGWEFYDTYGAPLDAAAFAAAFPSYR
jgi:hypothetical protein